MPLADHRYMKSDHIVARNPSCDFFKPTLCSAMEYTTSTVINHIQLTNVIEWSYIVHHLMVMNTNHHRTLDLMIVDSSHYDHKPIAMLGHDLRVLVYRKRVPSGSLPGR